MRTSTRATEISEVPISEAEISEDPISEAEISEVPPAAPPPLTPTHSLRWRICVGQTRRPCSCSSCMYEALDEMNSLNSADG